MVDFTTIDVKWVQVVLSLFSGGVAGALIKQRYDNKRNRIQPIAYEVELQSVYDATENKLFNSQITLTGETGEYKFSKLYSGTIIIHNIGHHDYTEFKFGVTSPDNINFIQVRPNSSDRHHISELSIQPTLDNQVSLFDITLKPLNRKDSYRFDFSLTTTKDNVVSSDIEVSTAQPIKWVLIRSIVNTEKLLDIIGFGPFPFGLLIKELVGIVKQNTLNNNR